MDSQATTQSADIYDWIAWAHANRKRLIMIVGAIVVVGLAVALYFWNVDRKEADANEALAMIKPPGGVAASASTIPPEAYLKVADDYQGTSAGARARLLAAGDLFDAGKFQEAQSQFERFIQQYPDSTLTAQAELGVAASLEAQGKTADAAAKYKDFADRRPSDALIPQAKSALARLDIAMGKPDQALRLYEELRQGGRNDTWTAEAGIQEQELLSKYPNLRPTPPPAAPGAMTAPGSPMAVPLKPAGSAPMGMPAPKPSAAPGATITNK